MALIRLAARIDWIGMPSMPQVSVPERGFVALIRRGHTTELCADEPSGFSPRAGIRGFDTEDAGDRG